MEVKLGLIALGLFLILFGLFLKDLHRLFTSNARKLDPKYMNDTNSTWETYLELDEDKNVVINSFRRYYHSRYI